jgi:hypothetical protein
MIEEYQRLIGLLAKDHLKDRIDEERAAAPPKSLTGNGIGITLLDG